MRAMHIMRIALVAMLVFGLAAESDAQMRGRGRDHRPGCGMEREGFCFGDHGFLRERLGLSDEQIRSVAGVNRGFAKRLKALKERIDPLQRELHGLLRVDEIDLEKTRTMLKQIAEVEVEMRMARIEQRLAIEKVFTEEQRERHRREMKKRR